MANKRRPTRPPAPRKGRRSLAEREVKSASSRIPSPRPGARSPAAARDPATQPLMVVGVGASAGGFEAVSQLLASLPSDLGLAMVFVQHLSPTHPSALPQLLAGVARMPVEEAEDGMVIRPNRLYVSPANVQVRLNRGTMSLMRRPTDRSQYNAIDAFFRSLAENVECPTVGILLSGNSSDGVAGLREIRAAGGTVLVQDPQTARFDSMPRSAIEAGIADMVLAPDEMGPALAKLAAHPLLRTDSDGFDGHADANDPHLRRIFLILRNATGVDFSHYKLPTIRRRMQRRMVLLKLPNREAYLRHLESSSSEVQRLHDDLLIQVTRFFRDPESFQALADKVFPGIVKDRSSEGSIRIWVPGCATGEEAYSVAIALLEHLGDDAGATPIQIFATDVSDKAIDRARSGSYPDSINEDVSAQRLRRFFSKIEGGYQISKKVRDLCVFARQDLARDPPFSKLDLIVCRNVLIYLDPILHKKLMNVFHYALKPGGSLMLGSAESVGPTADLFQVSDKKSRIFVRRPSLARVEMEFRPTESGTSRPPPARKALSPDGGGGVQGEANRLLLARYAPAGVLVDDDLRIVQARGHTGPFLELAPGDASLHLLKMVREGLLFGLRSAINEARRTGTSVRREKVRVKANGKLLVSNLEVVPLGSNSDRHFLVLFELAGPDGEEAPARARKPRPPDSRTSQLQQELVANREYLQSIIHDLEATNEALQSANEEILSANEELQSTNEELDTAKEELQSSNEEINTVNEELQARNEELSRTNSDLVNLLAGVQIAIVFLTADLRIRRFTPMAEKVLNLIGTDVGRPISNIRPNIDCPDLEQMIHEVVEKVTATEREVRDKDGNWFLLRVRPYKDVESRIDGAVLVLLDIHALRLQEERSKDAREFAEAVVETIREPLVVLESDMRVRSVNKAFCRMFRVERGETVGRPLHELGNGQWNIARLRTLLEEVLPGNSQIEGFEVDHVFPDIGRRQLLLNARRITTSESKQPCILLAIEEENAPA
jgi:two-component system CheB/CheR fusion protein